MNADQALRSFIASWDQAIVRRRLTALYRELTEPMKIKITERTIFQGTIVQPDEIISDVDDGPYRAEPTADGHSYTYIPQFEVMADDQQEVAIIQEAAAQPTADQEKTPAVAAGVPQPQPGTFAEATKAILQPAPAKSAGNPLAARVRALTARRAKFQDVAAGILDQGEEVMTKVETDGPMILQRSVDASHDELAAITDLADSLKDIDRSNG